MFKGDFNLFVPVKYFKTYIPENYFDTLIKEDKDGGLLNDWGLIYLNYPIENSIVKLLDIANINELKIINNSFYHYFINNEKLKLDKSVNSEKISVIGYNEYKDKYRNNSTYKFLNNFIKKNENEKMEDSFDEINTNISKNKNISNEENKKE